MKRTIEPKHKQPEFFTDAEEAEFSANLATVLAETDDLSISDIPDSTLVDKIIRGRRYYSDATEKDLADLEELTAEYITRGTPNNLVFLYQDFGTEMMEWVWGESIVGQAQTLEGYKLVKGPDDEGSVIVPDTGEESEVKGKAYLLTDRQLARTDEFYNDTYRRILAVIGEKRDHTYIYVAAEGKTEVSAPVVEEVAK